jgi:predicted RNA-binding protein YlxR (DUF448 family)
MRGRRAARVKLVGPHRRCVGCRQKKPQTQLLRIAVEGGAAVPGKGKPGRGCWVCKEEQCAKEAVKTGQFARAFKGKAKGPALERLLQWIASPGSLDGDRGRGLKS